MGVFNIAVITHPLALCLIIVTLFHPIGVRSSCAIEMDTLESEWFDVLNEKFVENIGMVWHIRAWEGLGCTGKIVLDHAEEMFKDLIPWHGACFDTEDNEPAASMIFISNAGIVTIHQVQEISYFVKNSYLDCEQSDANNKQIWMDDKNSAC